MAFPAANGQLTMRGFIEEAITMLRHTVSLVMLFATCVGLFACANTIRGVGRDVKSTANAVEDTVNNP